MSYRLVNRGRDVQRFLTLGHLQAQWDNKDTYIAKTHIIGVHERKPMGYQVDDPN